MKKFSFLCGLCLLLAACQSDSLEEVTSTASGAVQNVKSTVETVKSFKQNLDYRINKAQQGLSKLKEGSVLLGEAIF